MRSRSNGDYREFPRYGVKEAASCLGIRLGTLESWVEGRHYPTSHGPRYFKPLIQLSAPGRLSFFNLVEAHILLSTRKKYHIAMPAIRTAIDYVLRKFRSRYPLLTEQFLTDGKDLFVKKLEQATEQTINVSRGGQLGIGAILDLYLKRIERDRTGLPMRLFPFRVDWPITKEEEPPKVIVIDPKVSSGRPVVVGTGIAITYLSGRFKLGEGVEDIATDYGLHKTQVEEVIRYASAA